ncbi:MAG: DUF885 domain-containing protein [Caulobacterales bacterium]|nr:DUF885 domain-containing protein [Caulobacterales bacterium]
MKRRLLTTTLRACLAFGVICAPSAMVSPALAQEPAVETTAEQTPSEQLNAWFEERFQAYLARSPMIQSTLGIKTDYDKWNDVSEAALVREHEISQAELAEMRAAYDPETLDEDARLSFLLAEYEAEKDARNHAWRSNRYVFHNFTGPHTQAPSFLINIHRVETREDAEAYVARLNGLGDYLGQHLERFEANAAAGTLPPAWSFPIMIEAARNVISGAPFDEGEPSTLLADITAKIDALELEAADRDDLLARAETALTDVVAPAYGELIAAFERLQGEAAEGDGVWRLPDGDAFYQAMLDWRTTTDLDADAIHEIGLEQVDRVHAEMREIMETVGFEGDLAAFFKFMREDPQFYLPADEDGRQAYIDAATNAIDAMKERLPELFVTLPEAELIVKRVEPFREKSAGKAFYQRPAADGSRPGIYYINLYDMSAVPTFEIEALAFHEGAPGHHMQVAIAQELENIPSFRKFGGQTAYIEGWGLYSEEIPKELGFYADPYSDFGRLSMELWRAARLVVDTGLHHKKWTVDEAVDYLVENTPNTRSTCQKAIERYAVLPGQATAYMIGKLKIKELRARAETELGEDFDIRRFHDVIIANGSMPLSVLEATVDAWIAKTKGG